MVKLSMTLRLTISFIAILILACTGISWTLYNALSKELTYRDDMTLINRAAQMQQLLLGMAPGRKICRSISIGWWIRSRISY